MNETNRLLLPGLDGSNPLGFLAAIGTWRVTDLLFPGVSMAWTPHAGHWAPVLRFEDTAPSDFVEPLDEKLRAMHGHHIFTFSYNLKLSPSNFRIKAQQSVNERHSSADTIPSSFIAAFGSDATVNEQGDIQDTAFRTMSGAGHQHFLKTMNDLAGITTSDQLRDTLFSAWSYSEEKVGLRWDPIEDKRYALAWKNPSQDATVTQRGANRLAVEALPLFPTAPIGTQLETTGFTGHKSNNTYWRWPLWDSPIRLDVGRSLLALRDLHEEKPDSRKLGPMGIVAVFRTQRITTGKFRNFTPAVQIA